MPFNYTKSKVYPYLDQIKEWSDAGMGSRAIAKKLGVNRSSILMAYRKMGLETADKKNPKKPIQEEKECLGCHQVKNISEFCVRTKKNKKGYYNYTCTLCVICETEKNRNKNKNRYNNNKHKWQEYRAVNKDKINTTRKERMHNDVNFKLRCGFSCSINQKLRAKSLTKKGTSCIKFLPYTIEELKTHLELQFEPWMNWDNWGRYKLLKWDDHDQSTWRWNIDHIIPAAKFNYTSVEDEEFKQCWALSNLRPLSAKVNLIEGDRR
jgi:hypothetical protein